MFEQANTQPVTKTILKTSSHKRDDREEHDVLTPSQQKPFISGLKKGWPRLLPAFLLLPMVLGVLPIFFASLCFLFVFSFYRYVPGGNLLNPDFTLENYKRFFDLLYLSILARTMIIGVIASVITVLIVYPIAYWFNRSTSRWRSVCLSLIILAFFTIPVARVFAWTIVLGRQGFVNRILQLTGIIDQPLTLMYHEAGVTIVLIHFLLPLITLILTTALQRIDPTLELAAQNLGASQIRSFFSITLPLSIPGIVAALALTFSLCIATFTSPIIIGGGKVLLLANTLYDIMLVSLNFPFASALAIIALFLSLILVGLIGKILMSRLKLL